MRSANKLAFEALCALAGVDGLEDAAMLTDEDGNEGPNAEAMDVLRPLFAAAQAEARREALEKADAIAAGALREDGDGERAMHEALEAIRALAAKVKP